MRKSTKSPDHKTVSSPLAERALLSLRRQIADLQQQAVQQHCNEVSLFLGCAALALEDKRKARKGMRV